MSARLTRAYDRSRSIGGLTGLAEGILLRFDSAFGTNTAKRAIGPDIAVHPNVRY